MSLSDIFRNIANFLDSRKSSMSATITVKGITITDAKNIDIVGRNIIVDGKIVTTLAVGEKTVDVKIIDGYIEQLNAHGNVECGPVTGNVDAGDSVTVSGDVGGDVDAGDSVTIGGNVGGSAEAGDGVSVGGNVGGDIDASDSVTVGGYVEGAISAGDSVYIGKAK